MPLTPNGAWKADLSTPMSAAQISANEASALDAILDNRERYDYVWPTASDRSAQTGMVQGSRGYQINAKTEYLYDSSAWRLALPYAEFTASKSLANVFSGPLGVFSLDSSTSSDSTFVTPGIDGSLTLVNPGVYAVFSITNMGANLTAPSSLDLILGATLVHRQPMPTAEIAGGNTAPGLRTTSPNAGITFNVNKTTAGTATATTRVRIARIG